MGQSLNQPLLSDEVSEDNYKKVASHACLLRPQFNLPAGLNVSLGGGILYTDQCS